MGAMNLWAAPEPCQPRARWAAWLESLLELTLITWELFVCWVLFCFLFKFMTLSQALLGTFVLSNAIDQHPLSGLF